MNYTTIEVAGRLIGKGHPPFIIAEIGQAHDGSLGMAHAYIDAVAAAGADAIKFQTHIASEESTLDEQFRVIFSKQDATRYDYWQRMEFAAEQWAGLSQHAKEKGLIFLSSPFSLKAIELLANLEVPAWKLGSGELASHYFFDAIKLTNKPVLFSTGMSSFAEIHTQASLLAQHSIPFGIFQCTSKYPTSLQEIGLNVITEMQQKYPNPIGLSDHSGSIFPSLAALAGGADMLEVHVVFDKRQFGPDTLSSLTIDELALVTAANKAFTAMHANPVNKDDMAVSLQATKSLFTKSLSPAINLPEGTILEEWMLIAKKPGTGIPYEKKSEFVGKTLTRSVPANKLLQWEDVRG